MKNNLTELRDSLLVPLGYQLFITPLPFTVDEEYRDFAKRACEFIVRERSGVISRSSPRHYILHHFAQPLDPNARKILITHGWMSRAAYMVKLIRALHREGFEIYALDFPAHGEAKGWQLPWADAVAVIRDTLNNLGKFYGVIGHSFGGSMLLNALNLSGQLPQWQLRPGPERMIMLASPTRMHVPIGKLARRLGLSGAGLMQLRNFIEEHSPTSLQRLNYRYLVNQSTIPILCIHGQNDKTVNPEESIAFSRHYPHASLVLMPKIDHINILIEEAVQARVCSFFNPEKNT